MRTADHKCCVLGPTLGWLLAAAGLTAAGAQGVAPASESAFERFCMQDYLLGDWGGLRTRLKERGVDFEFVYFADVPSNVGGGLKEGSVYEGALMMMLDLYSDKLVGYEGGQFHAGAFSIHNGAEFSANYVGDLNKVSLLDFPDNLNLWELWYEQKLLDGKLSIKAGQLAIDRDFILPEYYNSLASISFLNQTFFFPTLAFNVYDLPYFPPGDHGLASTPYGTVGGRVRVDPSPHWYYQVGAYAGNVDRTRGGVRFPLNLESGALIYNEVGLRLNQTPDAAGPPGNLKLGGYYHTDNFYDMYQGTFVAVDNYAMAQGQMPLGVYTTAETHTGNYGLYFLADQVLWREVVDKDDPAHQGLAGFFRVAGAPPDRNLASFGVDGGLVYRGLIPKRDWDTLGLAGSYLKMSQDVRQAQSDINSLVTGFGLPAPFTALADYEAVIELSYKAQLTAWMTLETSVQRVFHPGGQVFQEIPSAWVVLVMATLRL